MKSKHKCRHPERLVESLAGGLYWWCACGALKLIRGRWRRPLLCVLIGLVVSGCNFLNPDGEEHTLSGKERQRQRIEQLKEFNRTNMFSVPERYGTMREGRILVEDQGTFRSDYKRYYIHENNCVMFTHLQPVLTYTNELWVITFRETR